MSSIRWKVEGTKKGALPICVEKRPCGKVVTMIHNVTNPEKLQSELQVLLGAGGSRLSNSVEIQGNHTDRITKYLFDHKSQLSKVSGCKEKEKKPEKLEESTAKISSGAASKKSGRDEERMEIGKPRWSAARFAAVRAASGFNRCAAPVGWDEDPRRCPFNWLYCSGDCIKQTVEDFALRSLKVNRSRFRDSLEKNNDFCPRLPCLVMPRLAKMMLHVYENATIVCKFMPECILPYSSHVSSVRVLLLPM
jgi:translation initiation factor 1 (eIF-1/SUI1)